MSLKDKASKIDFGALPGMAPVAPMEGTGSNVRPKTAPGLMMAHATDQRSELVRENEALKAKVSELGEVATRVSELQDELKTWDGAKAARLIDPKLVGWSAWANRDPATFTGQDFVDLRTEIASAGGNVQPIKVRSAKPGGEFEYEIVFGHRRHRACLELGLPVLAVIDNLGEVELFVEMERENRNRKNLSAWEQGMTYQRALEKGLFPSNRKLAEQIGVDLAQVGKALSLARLPREVIEAFASPLDLQFRWAKPLADAHESDSQGLGVRAEMAKALGPKRTPKAVLELLLSGDGQGGGTVLPPPIEILRDGKPVATVALDTKGRATVSFGASVVTASHLKALGELVEGFLTKVSKARK